MLNISWAFLPFDLRDQFTRRNTLPEMESVDVVCVEHPDHDTDIVWLTIEWNGRFETWESPFQELNFMMWRGWILKETGPLEK